MKTLIDNSQEILKNLKKELVDIDEILNIINEIRMLITEDKSKLDSIKDLKKDSADKNNEIEEVLLDYMGEKDLKILETGFPDKWKNLTKNWRILMNFSIALKIIKSLLIIQRKNSSSVN